MTLRLRGRARRVGDDINTDYIITSTRKRDTLDEQVLKRYLLETVDPAFAASVRDGDILVAGRNFGCGSAMEIAVTVILAAGIRAVVAETFSRTFYRNAINNGLLPVEADASAVAEGDTLSITMDGTGIVVEDESREVRLVGAPLPPMMLELVEAGGLVPFIRSGGWR